MPGPEASGWTCTTYAVPGVSFLPAVDPAGSPDPSSMPPVFVYPAESVGGDFVGSGAYACQIFANDGPSETFEPAPTTP
jgi:hypothetical protein